MHSLNGDGMRLPTPLFLQRRWGWRLISLKDMGIPPLRKMGMAPSHPLKEDDDGNSTLLTKLEGRTSTLIKKMEKAPPL